MIPAEIVELNDTELDAVSGGLLNNLNIAPQINVTPQLNIAVPTSVASAVGIGAGAAAFALQALAQGNG